MEKGHATAITLEPIGYVQAERKAPEDDFWGETVSSIVLTEKYGEDSLAGLMDFSHVEVVFFFDQVQESKIVCGARHPRNNTEWPKVGIFAQRGKNRPNRIGCTVCKLVKVEGKKVVLAELDAIDGTPVLDIKPVMKEYLPRGDAITQPAWTHEIMKEYWAPNSSKQQEIEQHQLAVGPPPC